MDILDVLNKKIALFHKILELTKYQSAMLEKDDIDQLDITTDKKQVIIDQLEEIDRKSEGVAVDPKNFTDESKKLNRSLRAIIDQVLEIDKKNNDKTKLMIDQQAVEIKKINSDQKKMQLYRSSARSTDGVYIDKRK